MNDKTTYPLRMADGETERAHAALEALANAANDAANAILAVPDLAEADEIAIKVRAIAEQITQIRYRNVARAYELEGGSSTRVAERLRLGTKQRADQLIKAARKAGVLPKNH